MQRTQKRNPKLQAAGAFFGRVHNWRTDKDVMAQVIELIERSKLDIPLLGAYIPDSKDYNEAITEDGSLVVLSRPNSKCARSFWYVLDKLLERVGGPAQPLVRDAVFKMRQEDKRVVEENRKLRIVNKGA